MTLQYTKDGYVVASKVVTIWKQDDDWYFSTDDLNEGSYKIDPKFMESFCEFFGIQKEETT